MHPWLPTSLRRYCWFSRYGKPWRIRTRLQGPGGGGGSGVQSSGSFPGTRSHARSISAPSCAWIASLATRLMRVPPRRVPSQGRLGDRGIGAGRTIAFAHPEPRRIAAPRGYESRDPAVSGAVDTLLVCGPGASDCTTPASGARSTGSEASDGTQPPVQAPPPWWMQLVLGG
jgi:hypothetical protein